VVAIDGKDQQQSLQAVREGERSIDLDRPFGGAHALAPRRATVGGSMASAAGDGGIAQAGHPTSARPRRLWQELSADGRRMPRKPFDRMQSMRNGRLPGLQRGRESDDASDCDSDARELTGSGTRIERPMIWAIQMTVEMTASTSTPMPPNSLKTPATNSTVRTGMTQSGILSRLFMSNPLQSGPY